MPKTVPGPLLTVLQREVPTVALFLKVERVGGQEHFFTSHDANLPLDGDTYLATNAFSRSAIEATADLSVGDMEIIGFIVEGEVSDDDVAKGLLDGARVELFLADRDDPAAGSVSIFTGLFGEASSYDDGHFVLELRDFSQLLKSALGAFFQATCRSDLGAPFDAFRPVETGCIFPIEPPLRQDSTAYAEGDFVRVATASDQLIFEAGLVNGGFEADGTQGVDTTNLTGWTVTFGNINTLASFAGVTAHSGTYFLMGGNSSNHSVRQDVDLTLSPDFNAANVDSGDVDAIFSIYRNLHAAGAGELARVRLQALDSVGSLISTLLDTGLTTVPTETWTRVAFDGLLPVGTRRCRVQLDWQSAGGFGNEDNMFDSTSLLIRDRGQVGGTSFQYEDRIYECTAAGTTAATPPAYDTTVANTTSDGTAVFTARDAFTFAAFVEASGEDGRTFTVDPATFADAKFAGDFFDFGALVWESGLNAGHSSQVKSATVPAFELLLQTPFAINPGDAFRVSAGCDKTRATCRDRFRIAGSRDFALGNVVNFRGEPDLPGRDVIFRTPDAQ